MHPYIAYQIWSKFESANSYTQAGTGGQKVVFVTSALWRGGARLQRGRAIRLTARMCDTLTHLFSSMSVLCANIWPVVVSHTLLNHMLLFKRFRNPLALSSVLTMLGMLQLRALGFPNPIDPLDSTPNL